MVKALIVVVVAATLLGIGIFAWQYESGEGEMFILPEGFSGAVVVIFNQQAGRPVRYTQGKRVYEIPESGILKTQFAFNRGWHEVPEFVLKSPNKNKLVTVPYVIDNRDAEIDGNHVCCISSGKSFRNDNGEPIEYEIFYIGTKQEIDKAIKATQNIHIADLSDE